MQITINIDPKNKQAAALLNFIRTPDYVHVEDELTQLQKDAIDAGIEASGKQRVVSNESVKAETRSRYPNLFKNV